MTLPPVMRVFFAVDLPQPARDALGGFIGVLKKKAKSNAIRWAKADKLHITLQFLAEVKTEHVTRLIENVRAQLEGVLRNTTLTFGRLHLFPNPYRPRVIVMDIVPQEDLVVLAGLIGEGIKSTGYEIEARPFRAHLTLGRIKQPQEVELGFLAESPLPDVGKIEVQEVVLFRSEPHSDGSKYSVLERITLQKSPCV